MSRELEAKVRQLEAENTQLRKEKAKALSAINLYRLSLKWVLEHVDTLPPIVQASIKSDLVSYLNVSMVEEIKEMLGKSGDPSSF